MNGTTGVATPESRFDKIARRMNLYTAAVVSACALFALAGALASRAVERATRTVRQEIQATRQEVQELRSTTRTRASADSARFERGMVVLELAVGAIAETQGSTEQRSALAELRRRRHVTPRASEE